MEAVSVVNAPLEGVVEPTVPGDAHVCPRSLDTFRFGTTVVLAMVKGAVPVGTVDTIGTFDDIAPLETPPITRNAPASPLIPS